VSGVVVEVGRGGRGADIIAEAESGAEAEAEVEVEVEVEVDVICAWLTVSVCAIGDSNDSDTLEPCPRGNAPWDRGRGGADRGGAGLEEV
jgi:hypothetical protein